jgi:nucleoside-diphosphate-sugar epimerase
VHSGHDVVVSGVAGFIGSHLAQALLAIGHRVVGIDCFTPYYAISEKRANLASLLDHSRFTFVEGDVGVLSLDQLLTGAEAVIHQAAQPGVQGSWGPDFDSYVRHNVLATQRLLEACTRTGVPRVVVASSSSVYGDAPTYPTPEEGPTCPVSPYGVTKLSAELLCRAYAQSVLSGASVVMLRYFTVYGPRQRPDMAFRRFLNAVFTGKPITVFGDGEQTRDFTFVSDAVRANLLALTAPVHVEAINIGGGRRITLNEVLDLVGHITGRRIKIHHVAARPGDALHTGADGRKAEVLLQYRPEVSLEEGLARQAAWQTKKGDLA